MLWSFWCTFKPVFPVFLRLPEKVHTSSSSILACEASTAYTSLYGDLEYVLKITYFIQNYLTVPDIGQVENIALCLKK